MTRITLTPQPRRFKTSIGDLPITQVGSLANDQSSPNTTLEEVDPTKVYDWAIIYGDNYSERISGFHPMEIVRILLDKYHSKDLTAQMAYISNPGEISHSPLEATIK